MDESNCPGTPLPQGPKHKMHITVDIEGIGPAPVCTIDLDLNRHALRQAAEALNALADAAETLINAEEET